MKRKERFFGVLLGLVLMLALTAGPGVAAHADDTAYDPALAYTEFGALNTNDTEVSENVGGVMHPLVMHKGEIISADEIKEMLANDGIVQATYEGAAVTLDLEDKTTLAQTTDANGTVVADSYTAVNPGTETITLTCSVTPDGSGGADQSCSCEWEVYVLDNVTYNASQGSLVVNGLSEYSSYEIYRVQNANDDIENGELVKTFDASELTFRNLEDHAFYRVDQRDKASGEDDGSTPVVTGERVPEYVSPGPSPRITGVTETTITVRAEPGKEYSIDRGKTWTDASSRIIDDLPSGTYKVVEIVDGINFASPDTYAPHVIDKDEAGNPVTAVTITKEPQDPLVFPLRVEPSMTSATIFWYEQEIGQQFLVLPNGQEPTELDWNDKAVKAGRESDSFVIDGLTQDTEYVLYRRTPGDATHDPSDAFSLNFRTKKFVELTDANKPTVRIQRRGDFVYGNKPKVGDYLSAWATAYPVEYQLYYADENGNPTGDPIETDHDRWVKPAENGKRIVAVAIQKVDVSGETLMTPKTATSAPTDAVTLKDNTTVPETGDIAVWISTDTTASPATDTVTVKLTKGGYEYLVTTSMDAPSDADWANAAASTYYKETAAGTNNDGHAFTGLATGAQYYVHVRQAATDDTSASQSSVVPAPPNPASSAVDANCLTETITPKEGYEILNMSGIWIKAPGAIYPFEPERIYQVRKAADDANGSPPSLPVDYRAPARPAAPVKPVVTAVDPVPGSASVSISVSPVNNAATYTVKDGSSNPVLILTPDAEHPGTFNVTRPDGSAADPAAVTAEGSPASMTGVRPRAQQDLQGRGDHCGNRGYARIGSRLLRLRDHQEGHAGREHHQQQPRVPGEGQQRPRPRLRRL